MFVYWRVLYLRISDWTFQWRGCEPVYSRDVLVLKNSHCIEGVRMLRVGLLVKNGWRSLPIKCHSSGGFLLE